MEPIRSFDQMSVHISDENVRKVLAENYPSPGQLAIIIYKNRIIISNKWAIEWNKPLE